jgi:hypothetical protein
MITAMRRVLALISPSADWDSAHEARRRQQERRHREQ